MINNKLHPWRLYIRRISAGYMTVSLYPADISGILDIRIYPADIFGMNNIRIYSGNMGNINWTEMISGIQEYKGCQKIDFRGRKSIINQNNRTSWLRDMAHNSPKT